MDVPEDVKDPMWSPHHEKILAEWADKAICYRWMHSKAENKYSFRSKIFTIPVIVLSTLTGTANFAIERVPEDYQSYVQITIGTLNIIAGIITTVQQFLKINELNEAHRVAAISWGKFYRNIKTELLKTPQERCDVNYLIKTSKEEFDRLIEISPSIDNSLINTFNKQFTNVTSTVIKPEICSSIQPTASVIYKPDDELKVQTDRLNLESIIKQRNIVVDHETVIETFKINFQKEYGRLPTHLELRENLSDVLEITILDNYIARS
jgi:hypothetical protein